MFKKLLLPLIIGSLFAVGTPLHAQDTEEAPASSSVGSSLSEMAEKAKDFFSGLFSSGDNAVQESAPVREAETASTVSKTGETQSGSGPKSLELSVESDIEVSDADRAAAEAEIAARKVGKIQDDIDDSVSEDDPVKVLKQKADNGNVDAQYYLGKAYASGKGVKKDQKQAVEWYRKAADNGNADAQNNLGAAYANGNGVEKNDENAAYWWQVAADNGNAAAQANLGVAYATGRGVRQDIFKAVGLWRQAANQDNAPAQYYLGMTYGKDDPRSFQWFKKAAEQDVVKAQTAVGQAYENGVGVTRNEVQAAEWYQKAADQGDAEAQLRLGDCYYYGAGVEKDLAESARLYQKAADQGNAVAQYNLGVSYWFGSGIAKNYAKAVNLWKLSAQQGNADALLNLGIAYQEGGKGVNKNEAYAYVLFNEAAASNDTAREKLQALEGTMSVEEINQAQELSIEAIIGKQKSVDKKETAVSATQTGGIQQRSRR